MKVKLFSRYSGLGASSRVRFLQYLPFLEQQGLDIEILPFFNDEYVRDLYRGRRQASQILFHYAARFSELFGASEADLLWIEGECLPWMPWLLERMVLPRRVKYVVDYDDAVFHRYDHDSEGLVRYFLHDKIDRVMQGSTCVIAGNTYLGDRANSAGARRVEIVPTVVDLDRYKLKGGDNERLRVGWIGTPQTWESSARSTYTDIAGVIAAYGGTFRAIGAALDPFNSHGFENIPWTEPDEVSLIQSLSIGIMPLQDSPWTRGKCGYKLIQYMACGIPVVASPVGVNNRIVEHGVTGFLAESDHEWREAVEKLLSDRKLRWQMGLAGRRRVEEQFSLQVWAPKMAKIFQSLQ